MTKDEAMKQAMEAITQYLAESPDPSEEAVENLCDARAVLGKTLAQPAQKRPQNCGTGYCSCIECVMEPAQQGAEMKTVIEMAREVLDRMAPDDHCREPYWTATNEELERFAELVRADEREACAKECEHTAVRMGSEWMAHHCAAAIRARGNT